MFSYLFRNQKNEKEGVIVFMTLYQKMENIVLSLQINLNLMKKYLVLMPIFDSPKNFKNLIYNEKEFKGYNEIDMSFFLNETTTI